MRPLLIPIVVLITPFNPRICKPIWAINPPIAIQTSLRSRHNEFKTYPFVTVSRSICEIRQPRILRRSIARVIIRVCIFPIPRCGDRILHFVEIAQKSHETLDRPLITSCDVYLFYERHSYGMAVSPRISTIVNRTRNSSYVRILPPVRNSFL